LGAIVESSDDAIISKDLDGTVRSWNAAAERIFGYKASEIIGRSITLLIPEGHQNEEPHIIGRIRKGERIDHYETVRQRKDGTLVDISLTVSPIKDSRGVIIGASKIARDVTEQKRVEREIQATRKELASLNEELEKRVQERTLELNQMVAQMEEFSYSVSHDLRSPVRAMQGYAKALEEDYGSILDDTGRHFIQKIIRSATRMDKLIVDVLVYSRLARSQTVLEDVSLEGILHDIIPHYPEMLAPKADITIQYPLPHVLGHEASLTQALSNLLANAVKFVPEGVKPQINIFSEKRGKNVRLWIKDNGIGIAPECQTRLFGMFERATQDPRFDGTGIGLAIVRKALEKMGGTFGLESSGTGGSSFWIELPSAT
jgi:PAS domain S-box-containing protein